MTDPQAFDILNRTNGTELIKLYYSSMPFMILPKDAKELEKSINKLCFTFAGGLLLGVLTNFQIKRINPNFLKLPIYFRLPIRIGVIGFPLLALHPVIDDILTNDIGGIIKSMEDRKNRLIMTRDLE